MQRGILETFIGGLVLLVAVGFGFKLYSAREDNFGGYYPLEVRFESAQGLKPQSEVRLGGVKIGYVDAIVLDERTLEAVLEIQVQNSVQLPKDSIADISSTGLLGNAYLRIAAGQESDFLSKEDQIKQTKSPVSLEELLGRAIFVLGEKN